MMIGLIGSAMMLTTSITNHRDFGPFSFAPYFRGADGRVRLYGKEPNRISRCERPGSKRWQRIGTFSLRKKRLCYDCKERPRKPEIVRIVRPRNGSPYSIVRQRIRILRNGRKRLMFRQRITYSTVRPFPAKSTAKNFSITRTKTLA